MDSITNGNRKVTIRRAADGSGEWVVRLWVDGKQVKDAAYFTTDKTDAVETAKHMVNIPGYDSAFRKPAGVIDCTPTWESIVMIHAGAAANGNEGAISELRRMARLADAYIAAVKEGKLS
jgi:hypothetical protein